MRALLLSTIVAGGVVALLWSRRASAFAALPSLSLGADRLMYALNPNYIKWQPNIAAATIKHGLPPGLLDALLYRESHYRSDVINGDRVSAAGAQGIAQFMPATARELGINPLDPAQAIDGAGRYLAQLRKSFGNWPHAVAAYNWGLGNVRKWLRGELRSAPAETVAYVSNVTGLALSRTV